MKNATVEFDRNLMKCILESFYYGEAFDDTVGIGCFDGGEWSAFHFSDSKYNTSDADLVSVEFHYELLKNHGCFMKIPESTTHRIGHKVLWTLSLKGYELLESLSAGSDLSRRGK